MKNKPFIFLSVILFGIIVSYVVFSWSEPTGNMPTNYKPPLNTSANAQDVDPNKPVIGNLNVEKLGGYTASDLLSLIGGPASYEIVEGTACPEGTILISKYYAQKTCTYNSRTCSTPNNSCAIQDQQHQISTGPSGWGTDPSKSTSYVTSISYCQREGAGCNWGSQTFGTFTCQAPITHVLCLTVDAPQ